MGNAIHRRQTRENKVEESNAMSEYRRRHSTCDKFSFIFVGNGAHGKTL